MKKCLLLLVVAFAMASCVTTQKTARAEQVPVGITATACADLEVAQERISFTLVPSAEIRRGGLKNCKQAAINEALANSGNADLILDAQFVVSVRQGLFGRKITSVTVTGRPAKYVNIHSVQQ